MTEQLLQSIEQATEQNVRELARVGGLKQGQWLVVGTSTSEVQGRHIGTSGTLNTAEPIFDAVKRVADEYGLHLAFQCCEHLNRALVVEEEALQRYPFLEQVGVIPVPKAGGSMAAYAYRHMNKAVVIESIEAHAGIDIGDTLIGMHLKRVAVPVRPPIKTIGQAHVTMAYTRPKLIGGARAIYTAEAAEEAVKQLGLADDCTLT